MNLIIPFRLSIGIHNNTLLMGILEKLLKLMVTFSWLSRFCELVFQRDGVFGIIAFEAVLEVINNPNQE